SGQEHHAGPRILAGVDGSPSSVSALRWATRQAALTGAAVDAVIRWHYPAAAGGYGWAPAGTDEDLNFRENAEKTLADAISSAAGPGSALRCAPAPSRAIPCRYCSTPPTMPISWWWAAADMAGSPRRCWAQSASTARITRTALLP